MNNTARTTKNFAEPDACLKPTGFINADDSTILKRASELVDAVQSPREKAVELFVYARDSISYEFTAQVAPEKFVASRVLAEGGGFCVQKAVLLCALGRAAGVPTALVFSDMRDHTMAPSTAALLGTDVMHHHGLVAFFLDDQWRLADPSFPKTFAEKKGFRLVDFDGSGDALNHTTTLDGGPHFEYISFHGGYADLPFAELMRAMAKGYRNANEKKLRELGLRSQSDFREAADSYDEDFTSA